MPFYDRLIAIESWLQLGAFFEYYTLHYETLSNIAYMSGTLWCVSLEGGVLPLGHVCQWTVRERLLVLSLQPPVAPGTAQLRWIHPTYSSHNHRVQE